MTRIARLRPLHVEFMPEVIEPGILYVSERYKTAAHLCCCGCGEKVVTPLNPAKWQLTQRRGEVSLYPSIGNWSLPCQSHYWIEGGRVQWSTAFTPAQIRATQARDRLDAAHVKVAPAAPAAPSREGLLQRLYRWFMRCIGRVRG
jgi:hypothetical protein